MEFRPSEGGEALRLGIESAQSLIGIVLGDSSLFRQVADVRAEHFYEPLHGRLWQAAGDLISSGRTADVVTIAERFVADPAFVAFGGFAYLVALIDKSGSHQLLRQHAEGVMEAYSRRYGASLLHETGRRLLDPASGAAASVIGELRQRLQLLEQDAAAGDTDLVNAHTAAGDLLDALDQEAQSGRERGAMTGLRCFDRRLRGLRPGWLITIGGRPSMAKSGLMRAAAYGCAERNPQSAVAIFSLEMEAREVAERALSSASFQAGDGIAYSDFGSALTRDDRHHLRQLRSHMPANVFIDDRSTLSVDDVRRRVWALKSRGQLAAVFIDYLQLMTKPAAAGRNEASVLGQMTQELKRLAREADIAVVILSQLSRAVESRDDKRPQLADLRDSGSIEQDSNAVLFPYREAYYLERAEPKEAGSPEHLRWQQNLELCRRRMDVIAAKVRGGAVGVDRQEYFAEYDTVRDLAERGGFDR